MSSAWTRSASRWTSPTPTRHTPHTLDVATKICREADLNDDEVYKLMRGNAIKAFGLERFGITE